MVLDIPNDADCPGLCRWTMRMDCALSLKIFWSTGSLAVCLTGRVAEYRHKKANIAANIVLGRVALWLLCEEM